MSTGDYTREAGRVARPALIPVWDPLVRVFHWSLVSIIAYEFLAEAGDSAHRILGYVALGLIAFRLIWGVIGTRHARFADFVKSPFEIFAYVKSIIKGHPKRYIGHNPAGGAMVIALLVLVLGVGGTGWAMRTEALWGQAWIENLHIGIANFMILFIIAHVGGVIAASFQHKENLVRSMVTGKKDTDE
ncbi:MAG: cytochrome b/b6 domain-containing protein [Rhizobiaceae bacterium]